MSRVFNFSPGPATLPEPVLHRAQAELLDHAGSGMSIMEVSHRGKLFLAVAEAAEAGLRRLLDIPADYHVLFLQGGASMFFSAVPMNLLREGGTAGYVNSGAWSERAITAARAHGALRIVASSEASGFDHAPPAEQWQSCAGLDYLHYTSNETIGGVQFHWVPDTGAVPLVADMSSDILSRPLDVRRFGLIYAGAQKNIAIAGLSLVIVHRDLCGRARGYTPAVLDLAAQAAAGSMLNTPPTFAWYLAGLVFEWLESGGGLAAMAERNRRKAARLYAAVDVSNFYASPVRAGDRSWMNVPFTLANAALDAAFLAGAEAHGLHGLKGHRAVGGMRASLYNAMPEAGVEALVAYMAEFERARA